MHVALAHQCQLGAESSTDDGGKELVLKPTRFMTNSPELANMLSRWCDGQHRHVRLEHGRAHKADVYPAVLCEAFMMGIRNQLLVDEHYNSAGDLCPIHDVDDSEHLYFDR